jgi:hypothetical protein
VVADLPLALPIAIQHLDSLQVGELTGEETIRDLHHVIREVLPGLKSLAQS